MRILIVLVALPALFAQRTFDDALAAAKVEHQEMKLDKAITAGNEALALAKTEIEKAVAQDFLGYVKHQQGMSEEGSKLIAEALATLNGKDPASKEAVECTAHLAEAYRDLGRLPDALKLAISAESALEKNRDGNRLALGEVKSLLGTIHAFQQDFLKAEEYFLASRAIYEAERNVSLDHVGVLLNLAQTQQRRGFYRTASQTFDVSAKMCADLGRERHLVCAMGVGAGGHLALDLGDYVKAERDLIKSLEITEAALGKHTPSVASMRNNLGVLYTRLGDHARAAEQLRLSLDAVTKTATGQVRELAIARTSNNLGAALIRMNNPEGELLVKESIRVFETLPKKPPFEYAIASRSLASRHRTNGDLSAALASIEKSVATAREGLGPSSVVVADSLAELGRIQIALGKFGEAAATLQQAIQIKEDLAGKEHPGLADFFLLMAEVKLRLGMEDQAMDFLQRALETQQKAVSQVLALGAEATKSQVSKYYDSALTAILKNQSTMRSARARELGFAAAAFRKSRVLDFIRDWRTRIRASETPELSKKLDLWRSLMECRAALLVAIGYHDLGAPAAAGCESMAGTTESPDRLVEEFRRTRNARDRQEIHRKIMAAVQETELQGDRIETEIAFATPGFAEGVRRVTAADVRGRLSPGDVLLEFASWETERGRRLGVFLARRDKDIEWRDLAAVEPIEAGIGDLLEAATDWSQARSKGETGATRTAEATATRSLQSISNGPLGQLLLELTKDNSVSRLVVVPEGKLALLPVEALTLGKQFALQRFSVSYLSSSRELLESPTPAGLQFGQPVIAWSDGEGKAAKAAVRSSAAGGLRPLPGAAAEGAFVQSVLRKASVLGRGKATESAIKVVAAPEVLHMAGHGVFRAQEKCQDEPHCSSVMGMSALVLEEAYGRGGESGEDGFLTGLELQSLKLQGTRMVFLSQCRMAEGVPSPSDGVYGMRRAISLAGARSLIAPLWSVLDHPQAKLVRRFYREVAKGTDKAEALRMAKLEILQSAGLRHPLHWAATILSGDFGPLNRELFTP